METATTTAAATALVGGALTFMVVVMAITGLLTVLIAKKQGRNMLIAFILGGIFGVFAILGYLIAGETEQKKLDRLQAMNAHLGR